MKKVSKNTITLGFIIILLVIIGLFLYSLLRPTKVALVNFQPFMSSPIAISNTNKHVKYEIISSKDFFEKDKNYDLVLVFGMGLKVDPKDKKILENYIHKNKPIYVMGFTTPENEACTLSPEQAEKIDEYIGYGNRANYQSLANYIRKYIHKKTFFSPEPNKVVESKENVLYHIDDKVAFTKVSEFEEYLKKIGKYWDGAPKIAIFSTLTNPFSGSAEDIHALIKSLSDKRLNIYPVYTITERVNFINQIKPNAIIYLAHGRMSMMGGEDVVNSLKKYNCPIFVPLTILSNREKWENDKIGMMGGYMSQSIVMPELDGCIYPYALNIQQTNENGVTQNIAMPDRLEKFSTIVNNVVRLKTIPNKDKRIAIYYFKGPGQEGLNAQGLEVCPSLYNVLEFLKNQGYTVSLPKSSYELKTLIMKYAPYNQIPQNLGKNNNPNYSSLKTNKDTLSNWMTKNLTKEQIQDVKNRYGDVPGNFMTDSTNQNIYVNCLRLGNITILPQPASALGVKDQFKMVHGTGQCPPYSYICAYLWAKEGFHADAIMHFGTHGSLEFTPKKQVALCNNDWPDALISTTPHFYIYTIGNVGEAMIAKRRSYATVISYITPPFEESNMRNTYNNLTKLILNYNQAKEDKSKNLFAQKIKQESEILGIAKDLQIDSSKSFTYNQDIIDKIDNYAEEIANQKIYGKLYTMGVSYTPKEVNNTVIEICADPIAYSLATIDMYNNKIKQKDIDNQAFISKNYLDKSKKLVASVLNGKKLSNSDIANLANITIPQLLSALNSDNNNNMMMTMMSTKGSMPSMPKSMQNKMAKNKTDVNKEAHSNIKAQTDNNENKNTAIKNLYNTIENIDTYKNGIINSTQNEFNSIANALNSGYISPSSGGDAISNPEGLPTGRNLYSINEETTPSEAAWIDAKNLVNSTLDTYKKKHGVYPKKVSYTFWSGEFIESKGTTIGQVLYMLGVEPIRDMRGRVKDVKLIPSEILGRPRIDIVVQTSGQFRDMATSRLLLIDKAVKLAKQAGDNEAYPNFVYEGCMSSEKDLVDKGMSPQKARELSTVRVFGGVNGNYGTGIQEMIMSGDKWENRSEIAKTYINNMGAAYTNIDKWGDFENNLFHSALLNTDIVVQPRQNNTWGALSLDHVYEFMGGLNLAVKEVTGKDPDAIFADYRNKNHFRMQSLQDAIGVESRSTILNPYFVKQVIAGGSSSAMRIMDIIENTYGWNVSKPEVISNELWNNIYNTWIEDKNNLGTKEFFTKECPASLEQITGVMLETARKGMWKASQSQIQKLSQLNAEIVNKFGASAGSFSSENKKLQKYIIKQLNPDIAKNYSNNQNVINNKKSMVLKEESHDMNKAEKGFKSPSIIYIGIGLICLLGIIIAGLRLKRKE